MNLDLKRLKMKDKEFMIKIIMIVFIFLLLNNCASYKYYKNNKQQKQIIEKQKTWLNI